MRLTISELARAGGVGVETVRFYQRKGLLPDPRPSRGLVSGRRHYGDADVQRLRAIRQAQVGGFTLAEIGELLSLDASMDRPRARALAKARVAEIDRRIAALKAARERLSSLARACAEGEGEGCPIIVAFAG